MSTITHPDFADGNVIILDEFDSIDAPTDELSALDECDAPRDWDAGTILFDPYV